MGKGSGQEVTQFFLSMHMGICYGGEGVSLLRAYHGEKEFLDVNIDTNQSIAINRSEIHGGEKREGGIAGLVTVLMGGATQVLPRFLAEKLNSDTTLVPGFRDFLSVFLTAPDNPLIERDPEWSNKQFREEQYAYLDTIPGSTFTAGFLQATNNPYLKPYWFRVRAVPQAPALNQSLAMIQLPNDSKGRQQFGANPAHMIFQCETNKDWGGQADPAEFDIASYDAAAQTLFDEKFALAAKWTRSARIRDFVQEILDHIQGVQFDHPRTGLRTLKLLRDDYDVSTLPLIDERNATLRNFKRLTWGDTGNEIIVTWTNPENEQTQTVVVQDIANISIQGGISSNSRNYYMVRDEELAFRLGDRDLAATVHPIATCEAVVDRQFWEIVPGDVVLLTWPKYDIEELVMRVMEVNYGSDQDRGIVLSLSEDIFSLEPASYQRPQSTKAESDETEPADIVDVVLATAPAYIAYQALGFNEPTQLEYPQAVTMVLAKRNALDAIDFDLWAPVPQPNGNAPYREISTESFTDTGTLAATLDPEAVTSTSALSLTGAELREGDLLYFDGGSEETSEFCMVNSISGATVELYRGVLDTTPRTLSASARFWYSSAESSPVDETERGDGETVVYRLLPRTSLGTLRFDDASDRSVTLTDRAIAPLRPANVVVGGVAFGTLTLSASGDVTVSWANRNRLTEAVTILAWNAATAAPEVGQTTTITLTRPNDTVIETYTGLTGTSHDIPWADISAETAFFVTVTSERDGFVSLQGHSVYVENNA